MATLVIEVDEATGQMSMKADTGTPAFWAGYMDMAKALMFAPVIAQAQAAPKPGLVVPLATMKHGHGSVMTVARNGSGY